MSPETIEAALAAGRNCPHCGTRTERDAKTVIEGHAYAFHCYNCGRDWEVQLTAVEAPVATGTPTTGPVETRPMTLQDLEIELRRRGAKMSEAEVLGDGRISVALEARGIKIWSPEETLERAVLVGLATLDQCIATKLGGRR